MASDPLGAAEAKTRAGLALGAPWNKDTQNAIQAAFLGAAGQQPGTNLPVPDVAGAIAALETVRPAVKWGPETLTAGG